MLDKSIQIVCDINDWMKELEQINKERNLTKHEYRIYNKLAYLREKYYKIHQDKIAKLNKYSTGIGYCPSHSFPRPPIPNNKGVRI